MRSPIGAARLVAVVAATLLTIVLSTGTTWAQVCTDCTTCGDGTACDDGNACTGGEVCTAGICGGGTPANEGGTCDDGLFCTDADVCTAGTCGGSPRSCAAQGSDCAVGVCNEATDACEAQPANEGGTCDDGLFCTVGDSCTAGTCGGTTRSCSVFDSACSVGVCNEAVDLCEPQPINEGGTCDDGLFCTTGDVCTAGSCAATPRDCSSLNGACTTGACNEGTDACEAQPANEGGSCDDGLFCTDGDVCAAGTCSGGPPRSCAAQGGDCTAGVCDEGSDTCQAQPANEGGTCDDGLFCTIGDSCTAGACGGTPRSCAVFDGACTLGVCNESTDLCVAQPANEGGTCDDGLFCTVNSVCTAGACGGGAPRDCSAQTGACTVGSCNETTDLCDAQPANEGGGCDDGLFCTIGDTCQTGVCTALAPRDCSGLSGTCATGACNETGDACVAQPINEGGACNDADSCTTTDVCRTGVCTGTPVVDCAAPRLIVASNGAGSASVMRTTDLAIEGSPLVGTQPHSVAFRPDGAVAYVTNNASDSVSVVDVATRTVVATIPVGLDPRGVTITRDGTRAYVANSLSDSISIIDPNAHAVIGSIELDPTGTLPPQTPFGVAVSTTGAFLYVGNNDANTVSVYRTSDNLLLTTIPVGLRPQGITASPAGVFVFVACGGSNRVNVIRVPDHANVATIPVGADPHSIAFTPDGRFALVTNSLSDTVSKINTDSFMVVGTIPVPQVPQGIDVRGQGDFAYVAGSRQARVAKIDVARNLVVANVAVPAAPVGLAVVPVASFMVAAQAIPTQVAPGGVVTYTLSYTNAGTRIASNVTLTASIPANATFANAVGGGVASGGNVTWALGTLAGGASGQVSFAVRVNSPLPPGLQLTTTAVLADQGASSAQATATATVNSTPQYSLGKVDDADPVVAGSPISYTITYANNAAANANGEGVVVTDTYPAGFTFVSSSPPPASGTNNQWVVGSLPVGGSGTIIVSGTVDSPLPNGTILNNRVRLADTFGNAITAEQNTAVVSNPTLAIALADDRDPATAGEDLVFTISYSNNGNADATAAVVTATYDPNVTFVSASPAPDPSTNNRWTVGSIPTGGSGQVTVRLRVASVLPNGTLLTTSAAVTDGAAFATVSENTVVSSTPALGVSILDAPDPARPGDVLSYTVTYANTGSDVATVAALALTYDPAVTFVSATPPPSTGDNQWTLGDLAPGAGGTVVIDVLVNASLGAIVTSNAVLSAGGALSASSSANTAVNAAPVLSLGLADSADPIQAGGTLTYTLQYGNSGNEPATGVGIAAVYDPNVTFVSATPAPDTGTNGQWSLGTLAPGTTGQISVTVQVGAPLANGTLLTTQATAVADGGLLATASESTTVQSAPGLAIAKTDGADPTGPGSNLSYTLTYSNPGTDGTTGVVVTEAYDPRVVFVSAVPPPDPGSTNTWSIGDLAGGASGSITVTVQVPLVADGVLLTNTATVRDDAGRSASASEDTTIASTLFSLDVIDDPDPSAVLSEVTLTLRYGNISGVSQPGVVARATLDPHFVVSQTTPAADAGTSDTWTLGTLAAGQTGQLVIRGSFGAGAVGALARTDAQVANANGAAFASETTSLGEATGIEEYGATLVRRDRHVLRTRAWIQPPVGYDPPSPPFSLSLVGPGGVQHAGPIVVPALGRLPSGHYSFVGDIPGSGYCKVKVAKRPTNWRVFAKCTGSGILPAFPPTTSFQEVIAFGPYTFSTPTAQFRELRPGLRRYP